MVRRTSQNTAPYYSGFQPAPQPPSIENNFTGGLKTEFTGLNFPENACTQVENCVFSIIGDVTRRGGIDFEAFSFNNPITAGGARTMYRWKNAGGDGQSEILVVQSNAQLNFFLSSNAGVQGTGISAQQLSTVVNLNGFIATGQTANPGTIECQFSDGNGFLFVYNSICDPFYISYNPSNQILNTNTITVSIRDFFGIPDGLGVQGSPSLLTTRPASLSQEHNYNLQNQGWTEVSGWSAASQNVKGTLTFNSTFNAWAFTLTPGNYSFVVGTLAVTPVAGQTWTGSLILSQFYTNPNFNETYAQTNTLGFTGKVISYDGTNLVLNVQSGNTLFNTGVTSFWLTGQIVAENWGFKQTNVANTINTWFAAIANYPSNADIWWEFKNTSNVFAPTTSSILNVVLPNTQAPSGHFILSAFNQQRDAISGIDGITDIVTMQRPTTGAWYAGRVWYAGVNDSQQPTGDQPFYTWTESIYYSQVVSTPSDFGNCYSINDPTNQTFFDPLPTDGGQIIIPGSGNIYKLFPMINGLLVFASNGVWVITGSQGTGFDATSYSVNKISEVRSISASSVVNVLGSPIFWNLEGIYSVQAGKEQAPYAFGGLQVQPITVGTILSFYNSIPSDSKKYAKGYYDPISYVVQWVYRGTQETGITDRYYYDSALSLNVFNKAFYPYQFATSENSAATNNVAGIIFMDYPSNPFALTPQFKYLTFNPGGSTSTFAEERNFSTYTDWPSDGNVSFTSSFTTGYKVHGTGFRKWQPIYLVMYSRNTVSTEYIIQAVWDYSINAIGKTSIAQTVTTFNPKFAMVFRRHKLRGHGNVLQIQVNSVPGKAFDFMGWAIPETTAQGA